MAEQADITRLLVALREGDAAAADALHARLYDELRRLAHAQLGRLRVNQTLNTTALVHEAYLKLQGTGRLEAQDRHHFLSIAARVMRQVIIDYARARRTAKRGGGAVHTLLDDFEGGVSGMQVEAQAEALLAMDEALRRLGEVDEELVQVVELRFFGGLPVEEVADVLGVSPSTVKRHTRAAKAFLYREMGLGAQGG